MPIARIELAIFAYIGVYKCDAWQIFVRDLKILIVGVFRVDLRYHCAKPARSELDEL